MATIGLACLGFVTWYWLSNTSSATPGDTLNYILAGLRLNVGHHLYAYGPGDPHSVWWAAYPIFSPPLMGVVFRPIVLLPENGLYFWWLTMDVLELGAVVALLMRAPLVTGLALIPLSLSVGMAMQVGNVDCVVLPGLLLAWALFTRGLDTRAALIVGLLASLKLTPVIFVWWLVVTGRRRAAAVAIACGAALAIVAMVGSEPLIFARFYEVTAANLTAPASDLGPPGLARALGMPALIVAWLPRAVLLGGAVLMWTTRRRPGISWSIGASLMWLASPVVALHTPALSLVAIAPLAWPMASAVAGRHGLVPDDVAPAELNLNRGQARPSAVTSGE
jgi:alpha-1,2-mannosyltransferase